ncbi:MAG TPA: TMEM175 family protein [Dyella sp.]|uniref:TMEM175 family protein n=1 Tax=Dyella sp. TaxID=1869338 RepID=UPI002D7999E1|nr:TMEM175 family protein [Dyella sp.]HET6553802.1 TMEM175 family protein [Dyella sp.]
MSTNASQLERLTFFSDAVFAIAITLLIIEVHVPHLETRDDQPYWQALAALQPSFMGFVLSFLVVGALWIAHHRIFGMLVDYNPMIVWPNMLLLMVVAFMPFATALMSSNPRARIPELFYAATLLAAGLLQRALFAAAMRPPYIRPDVPAELVAATRWRSWGLPTAAAISLVAAWFAPGWNNFLLLSIPLLVRLYAAAGRRRSLRLQETAAAS